MKFVCLSADMHDSVLLIRLTNGLAYSFPCMKAHVVCHLMACLESFSDCDLQDACLVTIRMRNFADCEFLEWCEKWNVQPDDHIYDAWLKSWKRRPSLRVSEA